MVSDFHRIIRVWKERQGFTVLELLAVFALLAIIAALVAPKYTAVVKESKVKACQSNIEMLTKAAEMYKEVKGDTAQLTVKTLLDAEYINEYVYCPVGDKDAVEDYQYENKEFVCKVDHNPTTNDG
jgi:prepilin-type N-terminal cleavage/methylation domain-containing protein